MKKVLFIIAPENFRDEELLIPKLILEKADIECLVASITTQPAKGAGGAEILPDIAIKDASATDYNAVIVVGGPGAGSLANYPEVLELIKSVNTEKQVLAAICIAPTILAKAGVLEGKKVTCFNLGDAENYFKEAGAVFVPKKVVQDGNLITGNGPAVAKKFAKKILAAI